MKLIQDMFMRRGPTAGLCKIADSMKSAERQLETCVIKVPVVCTVEHPVASAVRNFPKVQGSRLFLAHAAIQHVHVLINYRSGTFSLVHELEARSPFLQSCSHGDL